MRYTKYDLSIAILKVYAEDKTKSYNKYNVLGGRGGYAGSIEYVLKTTFTPEERALAGQVINNLQERALIAPTYEDVVSPGEWLKLTALGEQALITGALDELDDLLLDLHSSSDLLAMRYGAYDAVISQHTDWQRHAATSCRELITKVLHTVAPNDAVKNDPHFKIDTLVSNGITRAERIKHYLRQKNGAVSRADSEVIEKACALVEACYAKLSAITHTDIKEINNLIKLTEDALFFLLK
jgi:hypothetical protein